METPQQWEAVQGPMQRLWTWQQHEEAVYRGHGRLGPGSSYGRPVICQHPMSKKLNTPALCEET
ncbi:unnamed protein product [Staurois parvus]|uniref:Uncharacterized protein n=1 Tax=Staurois parvus TaxID=386267 RepID=A0ABN9D030_9NEOB|nr:unnamed protein product [Staurois parvus]